MKQIKSFRSVYPDEAFEKEYLSMTWNLYVEVSDSEIFRITITL